MSLLARKAWRGLIEAVWSQGQPGEPIDPRLFAGLCREAAAHAPPVEGASAIEFARSLQSCAKAWALASGPRQALLLDALRALADVVWRLMEEAREASIANRTGLDD